jgi:hypothetical protein
MLKIGNIHMVPLLDKYFTENFCVINIAHAHSHIYTLAGIFCTYHGRNMECLLKEV